MELNFDTQKYTDAYEKSVSRGDIGDKEYSECPEHGEFISAWKNKQGTWDAIPFCKKCRAEKLSEELIKNSTIPKSNGHCRFDNFKTDRSEKQNEYLSFCENYAKTFRPDSSHSPCIRMIGTSGTGKNHLTSAISKHIVSNGYSALTIIAQDFLDKYHGIESYDRARWLDGLSGVDLIVIDEADKTPNTEPTTNAIFRLIDKRSRTMKPTIIVGNFKTPSDLENKISTAGSERMKQYDGKGMVFNWSSYR